MNHWNPKTENVMKEKSPNRIRRVNINLTPEEYAEIEKKWNASMCKHLNVYVRNILFDKPIIMTTRNRSMDELMEEIIRLKKDLNTIGSLFNQLLKNQYFLQGNSEYKSWLMAYSFDKEILFDKIDEVKVILLKMTKAWLQ